MQKSELKQLFALLVMTNMVAVIAIVTMLVVVHSWLDTSTAAAVEVSNPAIIAAALAAAMIVWIVTGLGGLVAAIVIGRVVGRKFIVLETGDDVALFVLTVPAFAAYGWAALAYELVLYKARKE